MSEDRPYLEIPKPSAEDYRLYEEWRQNKEKKDKEERKVIIIDI
mgnify:CR=1 FL=1